MAIKVGGVTVLDDDRKLTNITGLDSTTIAALPPGGIKYRRYTANVNAVDMMGIIADTTGGAFTVTLPATPSLGAQVSIVDGGNWSTNNLTIARNGSTINGVADNLLLDMGDVSVHFVYDGTTWNVYAQAGVQIPEQRTYPSGAIVGTTDIQTLTNKTIQSGSYTGTVTVSGSTRSSIAAASSNNFDLSAGNYFTITVNGNTTLTVSNTPSQVSYAFTVRMTHTTGTITWFSGIVWPGGTAPTLSTGKVHLFTFTTDDGGTTWRTVSSINYTS